MKVITSRLEKNNEIYNDLAFKFVESAASCDDIERTPVSFNGFYSKASFTFVDRKTQNY